MIALFNDFKSLRRLLKMNKLIYTGSVHIVSLNILPARLCIEWLLVCGCPSVRSISHKRVDGGWTLVGMGTGQGVAL